MNKVKTGNKMVREYVKKPWLYNVTTLFIMPIVLEELFPGADLNQPIAFLDDNIPNPEQRLIVGLKRAMKNTGLVINQKAHDLMSEKGDFVFKKYVVPKNDNVEREFYVLDYELKTANVRLAIDTIKKSRYSLIPDDIKALIIDFWTRNDRYNSVIVDFVDAILHKTQDAKRFVIDLFEIKTNYLEDLPEYFPKFDAEKEKFSNRIKLLR